MEKNVLHGSLGSPKGIRNAKYLFTLPIKENEKNIKVIEYRYIKSKSNTIEATLTKHILNSIIKEFQNVKNLTIFVNSSNWCNIFKNSLKIDSNFENINKLFTIISIESIKHKLLDLLIEKTIPNEAKKGKLFAETIEFNL
uniref:Uncharacterized protein n=1 Tax=Strongyloides venezuelensis TaxID=75913 RepID=A0A0K0F0H9_STRVS